MSTATHRRLTMADLLILIAGVAVALMLLRMVQQIEARQPGIQMRPTMLVYSRIAPFLFSSSLTLIVVQLMGSRRDLRRAARQPGTIACIMWLLSVGLNCLFAIGESFMWRPMPQLPYFLGLPTFLLMRMFFNTAVSGEAVVISWATLVITRRWRPEPTWIDRSGRFLGIAMIVCLLAVRFGP